MKNFIKDKNIRGNTKKKQFYSQEELIDAIPADKEEAITILKLMSSFDIPCDWNHKKSNDLVKIAKKNETENKLSEEIKRDAKLYRATASSKRKLQRDIDVLTESFGTLCRIGKERQFYAYYWENSALKNAALGREEISNDRLMARALAFQFVDEYLKEFLPPSVIKNLEADMDEANDDLDVDKFWQKKLQFHPSGFELKPNPRVAISNTEDWNKVYDSLNNQYVIRASYATLHKGVVPETVYLSLQKIQYINHQVTVLAFVHDLNIVKTFEVSRLKGVEKAINHSFNKIVMSEYETEYKFEARVNVWVKDYFKSVRFGQDLIKEQLEKDDSWIISGTIKIPDHFSKNKKGPDPFAMANFLSGFADSMEVIQPDFLREEMKRRAGKLTKLYSDKYDSVPIISESPHVQTGNVEKLNEKKSEYINK
jgi:predicted DNA-binding transcriptional regulator YafY